MKEIGKIINGDCIEVMKTLPENTIDLVVTSCPYNVGIKYDTHIDTMTMDEYWGWTKEWLSQVFRILKDDGRFAINIPLEINVQERGGRVFFVSEFYQVMKEVGFKFFGIVDLEEDSPHRSKTTAWGSWMSCSQPYIYNPKECVVLSYKNSPKKLQKGEPQWKGELMDVEQEDGTTKKKTIYKEEDKKEFMELVFGQWKYLNDSRPLTKATFSMDIPTKAIKILSYKNDIVLDPFAGSATTCVAAEILDRRWIGIELSPNYAQIAIDRVRAFVEDKRQLKIEEGV
jgi:site-specific DNA-methyltransferase (adenine-specific)